MTLVRSIVAGLIGASIASTALARVEGSVVFEAQNGRPAEVHEYKETGVLVPAQKRAQILKTGFSGLPDLSHPQTSLVLLIGPNYQAMPLADIRNLFEGPAARSLKNYYERESAGSLTFGAFTYVSVAQPDYNGCSLSLDLQLARYSEATGDKDVNFDHVFYMGAYDPAKCAHLAGIAAAYASLGNASISNKFGTYQHTLSSYSDQYVATEHTLSHEFGHQLGWLHSNRSSASQHDEYGDSSEVMGSPYTLDYRISAVRKWTYGWMNSARTLRPNEYGLPLQISRRKGPELLMVPLPVTRLKTQYLGRTMLAIAIEEEVPSGGAGLPWRRSGLVPRIVSTGLPFSATSVLFDPNSTGTTQLLPDLVLDRAGSYTIPEAGVTIVVDSVSGSSAQIRILDNSLPRPPLLTLLSAPPGPGCYNRHFSVSGLAANSLLYAQIQNDGRRELMTPVAGGITDNVATFFGSAPISVSASVTNSDGSYSNYSLEGPADRSCTELPPLIEVEQTRLEETFSRECGLLTTVASNLGSASTPISGSLSPDYWTFQGSGVWSVQGLDSRRILSTTWLDPQFLLIGSTTVGPVECADRPVPKLQLFAPGVGSDCRSVTFLLNQSAAGIPQSTITLEVTTHGATFLDYESQSCELKGEREGGAACTMTFAHSLEGRDFIAVATSPSDITALQGELSCASDAR